MNDDFQLETQVPRTALRALCRAKALDLKWQAEAEQMSEFEKRRLFRTRMPSEARGSIWGYRVWREEVRRAYGLAVGTKRRRSMMASDMMESTRRWAQSKGIILLDDDGKEAALGAGVAGTDLPLQEGTPAQGPRRGARADDDESPQSEPPV